MIGPDAYSLESIKLHIAWFAGRDVAKHTARGIIIKLRKKTDFHWLRALTWPVNRLSYSLAGARLLVNNSY